VVDGPAPARCALMFRVGRSDETLVTGGVTHLVEHLALFPLGDRPYQYNGFVEAHRTVFHAAGRPEECVEFLASVTGALADLPMHRLEHEHRVLGAEAAGHGSGLFDALVTYRFGPRGLGLVGYPQFGVQSMSARQVDAWRAQWFTAANAALVVSGVPVESLRLTLPAGERRIPTVPPSIEPELPAWFTSPGGALGVSMVADRSPALATALRIAEKRLQKRLRTEMAIVYHVGVSSQFLDAHTLHVVMACDPVPEHTADALNALEEELDRLAANGPDPAELEAERTAWQREWDDPNAGYALADLLANDELLGAERRTPAAVARSVRAVSAQDVADALDAARTTALWGVPGSASGPSTMRSVSPSSRWRVDGRRLAPAGRAPGGQQPQERLVVGDRGVGIECGEEWYVHVDYEHCAAALTWRDGVRVLYAEDGFVLRVKPWEWVDGAKAVAEVDARLDPSLVIDMGEGDGPPEAPAPTAAGRPHTAGRRRWKRVAAVVGLALAGLFAVVMPFMSPTLEPKDLVGVPAEAVAVDGSGYVRCGGSSLGIVRNGARVPDAGPFTAAIAEACESDAWLQVMIGGGSFVLFAGGVGWAVHSRIRRPKVPAAA
jgi:hypothetical protein